MTLRIRALIGSACIATLATAGLTLGAVSASAHSNLIESNPAEGEIVAEVPEELVLTFSDGVQDGYTEVAVQYDGATMELDDPVTDGDTVTQSLPPLPADDPTVDATVSFRIVSADGHPVDGTFTFTIDTTLSSGSGTPDESGTSDESGTPDDTASSEETPSTEEDAAADDSTEEQATDEQATDEATPVATSGDDDGETSTGMLIGIGGVVALVLVLLVFELRRRANRNSAESDEAQDTTT